MRSTTPVLDIAGELSDGELDGPRIGDPGVTVWHGPGGQVGAYGYRLGDTCWVRVPGVASYCFDTSRGPVRALPHRSGRSDLVRDTYRRLVLPMTLQVRGLEVLHASGVRLPRGVVALCGVSETGKSTTAYALSRCGYPLWADDAVAFEVVGAEVQAIPLPYRIRLLPDAARYFADDSGSGAASALGVSVAETEVVPFCAVLVLQRAEESGDGTPVVSRRLGSSDALRAVLAHAHCFDIENPLRKRRMVEHYLALLGRVPVVEVTFRPGLDLLPTVVVGIQQALEQGWEG